MKLREIAGMKIVESESVPGDEIHFVQPGDDETKPPKLLGKIINLSPTFPDKEG